jgi:hypothetical protein
MLLQPGEVVRHTETVDMVDEDGRQQGTLFLTNQRVVFEGNVQQGILEGRVPVTILDSDLSAVSNAMVRNPMIGRPTLRVETRQGQYSFKTPDASRWVQAIADAKRKAVAPPPPPSSTSGPPLVVQVHQPSPAPTVYLHCTHCGSLSGAGAVRCASCGAAL